MEFIKMLAIIFSIEPAAIEFNASLEHAISGPIVCSIDLFLFSLKAPQYRPSKALQQSVSLPITDYFKVFLSHV